jgi:branched-chain amino acid transport system ATP-binding protein
MEVEEGEVVSILGRNGVGKSTLLKCMMGLQPIDSGKIEYKSDDITGWSTQHIARAGIGYVPQDRQIWGDLTVQENLEVPAELDEQRSIEDVYELFPELERFSNKNANELSGGQQQMLAIGRGLLGGTELLLLDEPSEGLAPKVIEDLVHSLKTLHDEITMVIIEQRVEIALDLADRAYFLEEGRIVYENATKQIKSNPDTIEKYLTI